MTVDAAPAAVITDGSLRAEEDAARAALIPRTARNAYVNAVKRLFRDDGLCGFGRRKKTLIAVQNAMMERLNSQTLLTPNWMSERVVTEEAGLTSRSATREAMQDLVLFGFWWVERKGQPGRGNVTVYKARWNRTWGWGEGEYRPRWQHPESTDRSLFAQRWKPDKRVSASPIKGYPSEVKRVSAGPIKGYGGYPEPQVPQVETSRDLSEPHSTERLTLELEPQPAARARESDEEDWPPQCQHKIRHCPDCQPVWSEDGDFPCYLHGQEYCSDCHLLGFEVRR
jgi:hypothetical protein